MNKNNKKIIGIFVFAMLAVVVIGYKVFSKKTDIRSESPPPVTVARAIMAPVTRYINAIGTLRPYDSVVIKSEVNSMISKIHFFEGAVVETNTLLMELDDSTAKASLMEAEAQYRKAKSEYDPIEKLADKGVAARIHRDTKKAEMDMFEARVTSCKNTLEKHKIYAPFGGIVGLREVSKGQYVAPGNDLLKLVDCHPLKVDFKVGEADIGVIYVGQEIKVLVGGDKSKEYSARISAIDPESDKISHTFDVRATLDVPEEIAIRSQELKPGRFVSVKVPLDGNQIGVVVPESAIEKIGDDDYIYRVVESMAVRTMVTTGMRLDGNVEITSGLNEDEVVITSGQHGVLDGRPVAVQDTNTEQTDFSGIQGSDDEKPTEKVVENTTNTNNPKPERRRSVRSKVKRSKLPKKVIKNEQKEQTVQQEAQKVQEEQKAAS